MERRPAARVACLSSKEPDMAEAAAGLGAVLVEMGRLAVAEVLSRGSAPRRLAVECSLQSRDSVALAKVPA